MTRLGYKQTPQARANMRASHKGKPWTPEQRANMSKARKGKRLSPEHWATIRASHNPICGPYPRTLETRTKLSLALKGRKFSSETRSRMSAAAKIRCSTPEYQGKFRLLMKDKAPSLEARAKISFAKKGRKHSTEHRRKNSLTKKGDKNPPWKGGIARLPYSWDFNDELRGEVRLRDSYKCQLCGVSQMECQYPLNVHHIDYDKKNSDPVNLITLCHSCHRRTNKNRKHWQDIFPEKMLLAHLGEIRKTCRF